MPRVRQVPKSEAHPAAKAYERMFGERDPVESPGTSTGTPGNCWTVFASVPDCFDHTLAGFALYAPGKRKISPLLRELAVLRTGYARGSRFVFSQHALRLEYDDVDDRISEVPVPAKS